MRTCLQKENYNSQAESRLLPWQRVCFEEFVWNKEGLTYVSQVCGHGGTISAADVGLQSVG